MADEKIYFDGDYFASLLTDISLAKKSIQFETYIFNNDAAGTTLCDSLIKAAKRGVQIRILVDGVGSSDWDDGFVTTLQSHGIKIKVYHPLVWNIHHFKYADHIPKSIVKKIFYSISRINSRDHRKLCIIDDSIVYIGSANITEHLVSKMSSECWRETTIRLSGVETKILHMAFEKAWNGSIKGISLFKQQEPSRFILNYSRSMRRNNFRSLLSKIVASKHGIWITNSYFVPDFRILKELIRAKRRGVEVIILLPHLSDVAIATLAARTFYAELLKAGVEIYEYLGRILHAKSLIVDDWYLIGSSNFNARSLLHDLEVDVIVQSEAAKSLLKKQFLLDLANAQKMSASDIGKQRYFKYILGHIILFFKHWP